MSHARLDTVQTGHDTPPFMTVWLHAAAILEVMDQPVRHLVRDHVDEKGQTVFAEQNRIEA